MKRALMLIIALLLCNEMFSENYCIVTFCEKNRYHMGRFHLKRMDYCWVMKINGGKISFTPLLLDMRGEFKTPEYPHRVTLIDHSLFLTDSEYESFKPGKVIKDGRRQVYEFRCRHKEKGIPSKRSLAKTVKVYVTPVKGNLNESILVDSSGKSYMITYADEDCHLEIWDDFYDSEINRAALWQAFHRIPYDLVNRFDLKY